MLLYYESTVIKPQNWLKIVSQNWFKQFAHNTRIIKILKLLDNCSNHRFKPHSLGGLDKSMDSWREQAWRSSQQVPISIWSSWHDTNREDSAVFDWVRNGKFLTHLAKYSLTFASSSQFLRFYIQVSFNIHVLNYVYSCIYLKIILS